MEKRLHRADEGPAAAEVMYEGIAAFPFQTKHFKQPHFLACIYPERMASPTELPITDMPSWSVRPVGPAWEQLSGANE